jgi:hypothetical protein
VDEFLFHIMRNKMKKGAVQTKFLVKTPLVALTGNEAGRIARSFVVILMANATAEAAVDEFIKTFPSLGELDREYVWFRPMMEAVSAELLSKVALGVQLRAALGAGLSIADMVSDAVVIMDFYDKGQTGFARSLMGMIGANMLLQAGIVLVQTSGLKKNKIRTMLFDLMTILTFTKPGEPHEARTSRSGVGVGGGGGEQASKSEASKGAARRTRASPPLSFKLS